MGKTTDFKLEYGHPVTSRLACER